MKISVRDFIGRALLRKPSMVGDIDDVDLNQLLEVYGLRGLAFLTAKPEEQITRRIEGKTANLGDSEEAALSRLLILEKALEHHPVEYRPILRHRELASEQQDEKPAVLAIRHGCGGISPTPSTADELERNLLYFAELTYIFRLQQDRDKIGSGISHRTHVPPSHQRNMDIQQQVMADSQLAKLYPTPTKGAGRCGMARRSTGFSSTVQLMAFADDILAASWHYAHLYSATPTLADHARGIKWALETTRGALAGRDVSIPIRLGLSGIRLPLGTDEILIDTVKLRRSDERDFYTTRNAPVEWAAQLGGIAEAGFPPDNPVEVVLETEILYRVQVQEHGDDSRPLASSMDVGASFGDLCRKLFLASLLADVRDVRTLPIPVWSATVEPLCNFSPTQWINSIHDFVSDQRELDNADIEAWKTWYYLVSRADISSIGVGVQRILRAVQERKTPEDTLVDAVIVWENLFGSNGETTLRVTAAAAWLLGKNGADRLNIQKELKGIYTARSKIVHGNTSQPISSAGRQRTRAEMFGHAERAVSVAIDLLRAVIKDHPELLKKNSAERGLALIFNVSDDLGAAGSSRGDA